MRYAFTLIVLTLMTCLVGCGPGYKIVPVSGTVTLDGKPLANALVLTQPLGNDKNVTPGPGSIARTDAEGHFVLEMQNEVVVGAVPGKAYIKIKETGEERAPDDDTVDRSLLRSKIPEEYRQGGQVEIEIPAEGTDALNFTLESKRRR